MEFVKQTDSDAVQEAARIWADATARRDETEAGDYAEAVEMIKECLNSSERSFVLVLTDTDDDDPEGDTNAMMAFGAIQPSRDEGPDVAELRFLGVAPDHWGEGWAGRLMMALPDPLREENFKEAILWVYADNIRAIFVYESLAWIATRERRRHPVTGRIEEKYRLNLT